MRDRRITEEGLGLPSSGAGLEARSTGRRIRGSRRIWRRASWDLGAAGTVLECDLRRDYGEEAGIWGRITGGRHRWKVHRVIHWGSNREILGEEFLVDPVGTRHGLAR